jgi:hypothetical protein
VVKTQIRQTLQRLLNLSRRRERGQSMVEMALALPILLLLLSGAVEIGMYYNTYLTLVDATREAARYSANGSPTFTDSGENNSCDSETGTKDFYKKAACLAMQNLPGVNFDPVRDDIVVSVILIRNGSVYMRFVDAAQNQGEQGWSRCESLPIPDDGGCVRAASRFSNSVIQARLDQFPGASTAPKSAYVLVEIYHVHHQFLGLIPPNLPFLPQEVMMHAYTIMPLPSAAGSIPD